jgi:hypothetical protein
MSRRYIHGAIGTDTSNAFLMRHASLHIGWRTSRLQRQVIRLWNHHPLKRLIHEYIRYNHEDRAHRA